MEEKTNVKTNFNDNESSLSLGLLGRVFLKCWIVMLLVAVTIGGALYFYFNSQYVPIYSSSTDYYVINVIPSAKGEEDNPMYSSYYSGSQISASIAMAKNFAFLAKNADDMLTSVIARAGYKDKLSVGRFKGMITATSGEEASVMTVKISGTDSEMCYKLAKAMEIELPAYCMVWNNFCDEPDYTIVAKNIKVTSSAKLDSSPDNVGEDSKYSIIVGLGAALIVYIVTFVINVMDTTVYTEENLTDGAPAFPVVGKIPHWHIGGKNKKRTERHIFKGKRYRASKMERVDVDKKLICIGEVPFRITEAFHELRTNVTFFGTDDHKGCAIAVASSMECSGKSFIIANLGVSLSGLVDKKVLVVDGDMRCPMIHKIFSYKNTEGLSNLIAGQKTEDEVIRKFETGNGNSLDVITAGTLPPNPIDLLSSNRMKDLIIGWREKYDYVLIDMPPLQEVSDALTVSDVINGYVIVVRSQYSDVREIRNLCRTIDEKNAKIFGYVLTDIDSDRGGYYYYSKYYSYSRYSKYSKYSKYSRYSAYSRYEQAAEKVAAKTDDAKDAQQDKGDKKGKK